MRFAEPEPFRTLGLAWRTTSPRRADFMELGRLISAARSNVQAQLDPATERSRARGTRERA
jgi:hypothetical protein